ncbi:MAG: spermidine synthase [Isosphaerales bacterium]
MLYKSYGIVVLFGLASFLGAVLLFSVQPMIGKMVLPVLGGTPAVWNTCLVYFQVMLLCGYLLTHAVGSTERSELRRVSVFYLLPLAILLASGYYVQPVVIQPNTGWWKSADDKPALALLGILCRSATLPLVMVSTTAPLVQCWFALSGHPRARDPYFLYAASNAGSLLALLAYPFVIEPNLGLTVQSRVWRTGYLILAILVLCCGVVARRLSRSRPVWNAVHDPDPKADSRWGRADADQGTSLTLATRLRWIVLVFVPSSWLMGVTTYLTTDLASIPLFWTIPLALYLLSFIVAFAGLGARVVRTAAWVLPYLVVPLVLVMSAGFVHALWIPLHLLTFFAGSLACHGALVRSRPTARHASVFYVTIGIGGLLGGIWSALVAPLVFDRVVEYPLAVVLACLVATGIKARPSGGTFKGWMGDLCFPGVVFLLVSILATNQGGLADSVLGVLGVMVASGLGFFACVTAGRRPVRFALVVAAVLVAGGLSHGPSGRLLHIERNFFGVVRVTHDAERNVHRLFHGSTLHGQQSLDPALRREPSTYFTRSGPIGQVFGAIQPRIDLPGERVAIVGLGAGTLASYAGPCQHWTFYEIDAAVERIARDPRFFTYLQDCQAAVVDILLGDARHRLRDAPDHAYRLIVLDAFSSDAVPVHLLSREAIRLYRDKLALGGLLAFNLSNRYLDLDPVIGRQAEDAGLICRVRYDLHVSDDEKRAGKQPSIWAVMAATEGDLGSLVADSRWQPPALRPGSAVWTDDYSDLASYLMLTPLRLWKR